METNSLTGGSHMIGKKMISTLALFTFISFAFTGLAHAAEIGQDLKNIQLLDMKKNPVQLPYFGEKVLYMVYADVGVPKKGPEVPVTDAVRQAAIDKKFDPNVFIAMGIVNMKDSWLPNFLIKKGVEGKIKENEENGIPYDRAPIFMDFEHVLRDEWQIGDCNNVIVLLIVGKDKKLKYVAKIKSPEEGEAEKEKIVNIIIAESKK